MRGSSQMPGPFASCSQEQLRVGGKKPVPGNGGKKGSVWYFSKDEIKANSPSKKDGIDLAKVDELRKSYCSFLKELGIRLRVPNDVIATSMVFCHRFFIHQSHSENDRFTIATACMFLAGKVEEARRVLEDVALVSYYLQNKNSPTVGQEMKDRGLCEKQKELVLLAEQVVLVTLDFDLEVKSPYRAISDALKSKQVPDMLMPVASIVLNDSLFTTLFLQFESEQIAAGALFLAAKLIKFKLPETSWWKPFNVTLGQLEEICLQILEFYEQERLPPLVVQSSSSSSSIDKRARSLVDPLAAIPDMGSAVRRENGLATFSRSPAISAKNDSHSYLKGSASRLSEENANILQYSECKPLEAENVAKKRRVDENRTTGMLRKGK